MDASTGPVRAEQGILKWGGAAAMIGGVLALVVNILHPRPDEFTAQAELDLVAGSDSWLLIHLAAAWATAFVFVGLVAAGSYIERAGSPTWARLARASAIGGSVVAFLGLAVDGMALKEVADTGGPGATFVAEIGLAFFTALIGATFGLTPLVFGMAQLATGTFPRWIGMLAVAGGALGLLTASIQYLSGPSTFVTGVMFTIGALIVTVWIVAVGWSLWKAADAGASEPATAGRVAL